MSRKVNYVGIGASFFGLVLLLIFVLFWLHATAYSACSSVYDIHFSQHVNGLRSGDPVTFKGIECGRVLKIFLKPDDIEKIVVRICLLPHFPIKTDSTASLELKSITGGSVIQIVGGSQTAQRLESHNGNPPLISSRPSKMESIVEKMPEFMEELTVALKKINELIEVSEFKEIFLHVKNASKHIDGAFKSLTAHQDMMTLKLNKLLSEGTDALTSVRRLFDSIEKGPTRFLHKDSSKGVSAP